MSTSTERRTAGQPDVRVLARHKLTGDQPRGLRLAWQADPQARAELEEEIFGKHVLVTSHDDWPVAGVVAGYRSQSEAEFSFRQLQDRHVVSFSRMHHWTDHNIRVHVFTCVPALQLAHLMRCRARQHDLRLSVRELLCQLSGTQETVLICPSTGGRPRARRMTTELTGSQPQLCDIFSLDQWAPQKSGHTPKPARSPILNCRNSSCRHQISETRARAAPSLCRRTSFVAP